MDRHVPAFRWVLLVPAIIAAFFVSHCLFQLLFRVVQAHVGISDEDLYGMSIMDEVGVFGPYEEAVFAFVSVLFVYLIAPRGKFIASIVILSLQLLLSVGVTDFFEASAIGGFASLLLAVGIKRTFDYIRRPAARA
jgi:hypothetical protein